MGDSPIFDTLLQQRLRPASSKLMWLGIAMILLGAAAIVFPIVSTLAATAFIGALLLIAGCFMLAGSFAIHGAGPFFGAFLFSLLSIGAGVFLLFNPAAGEVALTLMLGVLFMVQSAFETAFALQIRPSRGWVGMLISGILSLVLAILILAAWPSISAVMLGILFGVNFISTGVGHLLFARALRH
jgi:uncharacterized membrane protein HdeD (DUF308 family)